MQIKIGPAGTGGNASEGLKAMHKMGIDACEIEFTYGVRMANETALLIGELAKKMGISLSVHAPYYINLNSEEEAKVNASKRRIVESCERAHHLGASYVVFHAGFYGKMGREQAYTNIKNEIIELQKEVKKNRWAVILAPEITGKPSQFGSLDELIQMRNETGCEICVDFAHLKARANGAIGYNNIFKKLGSLQHIHSHFSGIEWTEKGERRHLLTKESDIKELLSHIIEHKADITIINESPDPLGDSIKTKRILQESLKHL